MSRSMGILNRVLLVLLGLVLLLGGLGVVAVSSGIGAALTDRLPWPVPGRDDLLRPAASIPVPRDSTLVLVLGAAVVLTALALAWLVGQLPPRRPTPRLRLATSGLPGSATVAPGALADALETEVAALDGITTVRVEVYGAAAEPRADVRVTADERSDLADLTARVHARVAEDLSLVLGRRVDRLTVRVELTGPGRVSDAALAVSAAAAPATRQLQ